MYSNKHIAKISYPILLSLLAQNIIQVTDTAFLGRVGEVELGASALAGIIYIAIYTLGFGFSMGSQILIGRRNGEKNFHKIGEIVVQGVVFLLISAMFLIPLLRYGSANWFPALFESPNVANAVSDYLEWRSFGLIFSFTNLMFRAFYIGTARTKVLTLNALVMAVVNIVFDYVLIFGKFGFPELGIKGAGIASVIAEASSTLFFVIYTKKTVDLKKYGFGKFRFQWSVIKKTLDISVFMMMQYFTSLVTWMIFFLLIENYMGERSLAVTNIVRSLYMIFIIPSHALGATTNTLISNTIGAGRKNEIMNLIKRLSLISLGVMFCVIAISAVFAISIIRIYTPDDPILVNETLTPLYVLISFLPLYAVGSITVNSVSGSGNTRTMFGIEMVTLVIYLFYAWFVIVHLRASVAMAWTTEHVYWFFLTLLSFIYMRSGKWKDKEI
jgi:putative MATE family efflux protein